MFSYQFAIFEKTHIQPSGDAILYGIENELLPFSAAIDYEVWMMENGFSEGSPEILSIESKDEAIKALRAAGYFNSEAGKKLLRYAALASLDRNDPALFENIEIIYVDFGYPRDLEPCVYYMPSKAGKSSPEALSQRFETFLVEEKRRLGLHPDGAA